MSIRRREDYAPSARSTAYLLASHIVILLPSLRHLNQCQMRVAWQGVQLSMSTIGAKVQQILGAIFVDVARCWTVQQVQMRSTLQAASRAT